MSTSSLPQHDEKDNPQIDGYNPPTQVCINDYWHGKPPTAAGRAIGEYHWRRAEVTPYELMQLVAEGKAFTALLGDQTHTSESGKNTGIHRTSTNFKRLEYVGVDFDDGTSLEDILDDELARECGSFAYATASHTLQAPRSRLVFCLEAVIEDVDLAAEVIAAIVWHYGEKRPDKGAKGAVRIWYGTKQGNPVRWIGGQLWATEVDRLLTAYRAAPEYRQPTDGAAGALADMVAEDLAPDLAKYGLKPQTLELIHNPADKGERSDADADIVRALWLASASIQTIFNVYEHYPCGQAHGTKYAERGRPYLEQHINGVIAWRNGWTNEDALAWEAARRNEEPEHAPWAANGTTTTEKPTDGGATPTGDAAARMLDERPARKSVWTTAELLAAEFPDPIWIVPDMLPVGLASLAGRPKLGKSWMALQIAVAVGSGGMVLGKQVEKREVLYLALEDGPQRLQTRLRQQQATRNTGITFVTEFPSLAHGGAKALLDATESKQYGLIVVDTFSKAAGRLDQMDLGVTGELLGRIQRTAIDNNILLLLVDHHRKSAGNGDGDPVDDVMGSTGKSAPLDVSIGLYRQRGQKDAILKITGRDIEEQELSVAFDKLTGCWQMVGTAHGVRMESLQADIVNAIEELGGAATAAEIAKFLGKLANNISAELQELVAKGAVIRGQKKGVRIPYSLPTAPYGIE